MAEQGVRAGSSLETGFFRMFELPLELRQIVVNSLVPDHLPIGTSPRVSADTLSCRKTLFNLCLTSKACHNLALRPLYKYVIITDYVQTAGLLVTLIFHKERRAWIHRLAVLVETPIQYEEKAYRNTQFMAKTILRLDSYKRKSSEPNTLATFNAVRRVLPRLKDKIDRAHEVFWNIFVSTWLYDFPQDLDTWSIYERELTDEHLPLLELLLYMQINVKDILVTVPPESDQSLCPAVLRVRIMRQFQLDPTQPVPGNPFKNLVSIRKQAGRAYLDHFTPDPLAPEYLRSTDWEFFQDNGDWFFDGYLDDQGWPLPGDPPRALGVFSHVTDLGLLESSTHPAQLRMILESCKSLKALHYTANPLGWTNWNSPVPSTDEEEGTPVPTLQQALDEVKETLTELRLGLGPRDPASLDLVEEALAPHKVDVSEFPLLTPGSIDIDPAFLG